MGRHGHDTRAMGAQTARLLLLTAAAPWGTIDRLQSVMQGGNARMPRIMRCATALQLPRPWFTPADTAEVGGRRAERDARAVSVAAGTNSQNYCNCDFYLVDILGH